MNKQFLSIIAAGLMLGGASQVHAMENGEQGRKRIKLQSNTRIKLQSNDGLMVDISEKEAHLFGTLKDMLEDITREDENPVPVSMSGDDLQAMVEDIAWIRNIHAAHNQSIDDIDNIVQLDGKTRRERARQSVENIGQIPMYSDETLLKGIKAASCLDVPESVEKNAKIISELLVSKKFLRALHANPDNNAVQSVFSLPQELQNAIHSYMPPHWGEHMKIEHDMTVKSVVFSPNGELLATGSHSGGVRIIEVATGVVQHSIKRGDTVHSVAFSPNGQWLALGSWGRDAEIIEVATGIQKRAIRHDGGAVLSVAFSPNNELLATGSGDTGSGDHNARIIEVATGVVKHTIKHDSCVCSVAFSSNGELLATGSRDGNARIIEVATGVVKHTIEHDDWVRSVAFSPNGQYLATGSWDGNARIIEVATGDVKHTIEHDDWVRSVAFSPNGQYLITGSRDHNARIIEVATGVVKYIVNYDYLYTSVHVTGNREYVRREVKRDNQVFSVAFSPNGELYVAGLTDNNARIDAYLTDNFKNAVLVSYLKSCQENAVQPNMRGWVLEAIQNHRYRRALKNAFPGLATFGAE